MSSGAVGHKCEACGDFVRKGTANFEVGRKLSGVVRLVHDRARCRQKWDRMRVTVMSKWPENREKGRLVNALEAPVATGTKVIPTPLMSMTAGTAAQVTAYRVIVAGEPATEAAPVEVTQREGTMPKQKRHYWKLKPATEAAILSYFETHPYRPGASGKLHAVLEATAPDLLVDLTGERITEPVMSAQVTKLLRDTAMAGATAAKPPVDAPAGPPDLLPAVEAGEKLLHGVLALVKANDMGTLNSLLGLMQA